MKYKLREDVKIISEDLDFEEYLPYIKEEAKIIKANFSQEVINEKLTNTLYNIIGDSQFDSIYGKLTGDCFSDTAHNVIFQLPVVVSNNNKEEISQENTNDITRGTVFLTPIEYYIIPTEKENDYFEERDYLDENPEYPEEYYERVKKVIDLLVEND